MIINKMSDSIPLFKVFMPEGILEPLKKTLYSGYLAQGPKVLEFEDKLKEFIGNPNCITTDSGTHALQLALRLANINPGDEVISSPLTCVATNMPIMNMFAKIKWADILPETGNIDPQSIEKLITPKTKAILYVHWAGNPANISDINEIAKKHNLKVIEDAAHSFGAEYQGKKLGNHSDFVMFSFQAIKHMNTGDGGCLFCKSNEDYERGKSLRWFGLDREKIDEEKRWNYDILESGYKFNMNDLDATIGIEQMKHIRQNLGIRQRNGIYYDATLNKIEGITVLTQEEGSKSAYWVYTLLAEKREELMKYLNEKGIATSIVHTRNDVYTCFKEFKDDLERPGLDKFSEKYVSIPCGWWVTEKDAEFIVEKIKEFYEK